MTWTPEQRLGLVLGMGIGAAAAAIAAAMWINPERHGKLALYCEYGHNYCTYLWGGFWGLVLLWATVGALLAGAVILVVRLLRP